MSDKGLVSSCSDLMGRGRPPSPLPRAFKVTSVSRRPLAFRAMGDYDGQGHGRIKVDDQACGLPGFLVIPMDIQPSFAVVPQLHPVPRFMPNG